MKGQIEFERIFDYFYMVGLDGKERCFSLFGHLIKELQIATNWRLWRLAERSSEEAYERWSKHNYF